MNESKILNKIDVFNTKTKINHISQSIYHFVKRLLDILIASIALIILLPVFIIVMILIKKEDHGSIFLIQERIGQNGEKFKLYKFRSMIMNADEVLKEMLKNPEIKKEYIKKMKLPNDPRITKIGKFIRKTSIDELPQLVNVLKGNMSFVGNRPYLPREKEEMGAFYDTIIKTKPGITGYWQVNGRSNTTFIERCKLEYYYSNNANLFLDIKIFFLTFYVVLLKKGAE